MNRFEKELMRQYLRDNIELLNDAQRREFVRLFGPDPGQSSLAVINQIDNKMLRRAHKHVSAIVKNCIY